MRINTNIPSLQAYGAALRTERALTKASERLSTGVKINSASDDAAGLAISGKLRNQVNGIGKASQNASNGISLVQTAEGSLSQIQEMVHRIRELAVEAANGTNENQMDTGNIQAEISQLKQEVDAMAGKSEYNKIKLLSGGDSVDGSAPLCLKIHVGANRDLNMTVTLPHIKASMLPLHATASTCLMAINVASGKTPEEAYKAATLAIGIADKVLADISTWRSRIGAYADRLQYTIANLDNSQGNAATSLSRIFDTDMAAEMTEYSKFNVLSQAATSIMAQANQRPQQVLQLIK